MPVEGLNINANLNLSSFERGMRSLDRRVEGFARRAPRMAIGGALGGAVSAGAFSGAILGGLDKIQGQQAFAYGIKDLTGPEAKVYHDIDKELSLGNRIPSILNLLESDREAVESGMAGQSQYERMGLARIRRGTGAEEGFLTLMNTARLIKESGETAKLNRLFLMYPGLKGILAAESEDPRLSKYQGGITELIGRRMGPGSRLHLDTFMENLERAQLVDRGFHHWEDMWRSLQAHIAEKALPLDEIDEKIRVVTERTNPMDYLRENAKSNIELRHSIEKLRESLESVSAQ